MKIKTWFIFSILVISGCATKSPIDKVDFETLYSVAVKYENSEEGQKYLEKFNPSRKSDFDGHMDALRCGQKYRKELAQDYRGVFVIREDGWITDFVLDKKNKYNECYRAVVVGRFAPKPPRKRVLMPLKFTVIKVQSE